MALTREKKEAMWKDVQGIVDASKSVVFVGFKGLTVRDATALRRGLKAASVGYRVVKKRIAAKVLAGAKVAGTLPEMTGQVGFAYATDLVAPAREVYQAGKKLDGKVSILGGIFDGAYKTAAEYAEIATIPPTDTLRGMFVNIVNSPIQRFAIALSEIAKAKAPAA